MSVSVSGLRNYVCAAVRAGVRRHLRSTHMTQRELADACGCSVGTVSLIVRGKMSDRGPTVSQAAAMALVMGVTLDELCGLDEVRARMEGEE